MAMLILMVITVLMFIMAIMYFSYIAGWFYNNGDILLGVGVTLYVLLMFGLLLLIPFSLVWGV